MTIRQISICGDSPTSWGTFVDSKLLPVRFDSSSWQLTLAGRPILALTPVMGCMMRTLRVLRWSSDEIVEDYEVEFDLLGRAMVPLLRLRFDPYDWPGFCEVQKQLTQLAAKWKWPLTKREERVDKI